MDDIAMFKSPSFLALIGAIAMIILQLWPFPGVIMMGLGGSLLSALLIHVFLISLFVEAVIGRLPRFFVVIPIAAYGAYYVAYWSEGREIAERAAELRKLNPGKVLDFDPARDVLVGKEIESFMRTHEIVVAYEPNENYKAEGYLSHRLFPADQCRALSRDGQGRIFISWVSLNLRLMPVCSLRFPEKPEGRIVTLTKISKPKMWEHNTGISEAVTDVSIDGKVIGSYRGAFTRRLPAFPTGYIGCGLNSSKLAWECGYGFMRKLETLDTIPDGVDRTKFDTPESILLGLRKYTEQDLLNFKGFASNAAVYERIAKEPKRVEDEAFVTLDRILDGEAVKPIRNMGDIVGRNPERLGPFAERMAKRLSELWSAKDQPDTRELVGNLASAIIGLSTVDFQKIAPTIFALVESEDTMRRFPVVYLRAADAGPQTLDFYKREILVRKDKTFLRKIPVLAICRIGRADAEILAELKRRYEATDERDTTNEDKTALFVTLLKLGQESYLREHPLGWRDREWAGAVLAGKGRTEVGPNNCMPKEVGGVSSPVMQPSLWRVTKGWDVQPAK
jgi:hypothetical protein